MVNFSFFPLRFSFRAIDSLHFPPGKSGNIVRGAFGTIFRKLACGCGAVSDRHVPDCPYARIFEPTWGQAALSPRGQSSLSPAPNSAASSPSGLADPPRPFVFRAAHLDGRTVRPGDPFHFDLHLWDKSPDLSSPHLFSLPYFVVTFAQLAREGLGPGRGRAELARVDGLNRDGVPDVHLYDGETLLLRTALSPVVLHLSPHPEPVNRVCVRFLTPTELKSGHQLAPRPEFPILFARIRDRISTLRALYGPGPLDIDFRAMAERSQQVKMTSCDLRHESLTRRSAKTGQCHPLGGFTGEAEYEGPLAEFLPYLLAARWTGVGRQTVWGKGAIEVQW